MQTLWQTKVCSNTTGYTALYVNICQTSKALGMNLTYSALHAVESSVIKPEYEKKSAF